MSRPMDGVLPEIPSYLPLQSLTGDSKDRVESRLSPFTLKSKTQDEPPPRPSLTRRTRKTTTPKESKKVEFMNHTVPRYKTPW